MTMWMTPRSCVSTLCREFALMVPLNSSLQIVDGPTTMGLFVPASSASLVMELSLWSTWDRHRSPD